MTKKLILILLLLSFGVINAADKNQLREYVNDTVYSEGQKRFPIASKEDIFLPKVYDLSKSKLRNAEAVRRLKSVFQRVILVGRDMEKNYLATFIYVEKKTNRGGGEKRKVISGTKKMRVDGYTYKVTPKKDGIRIVDLKTGVDIELKVKGR